ncbi:MAG: NUDIX domain-containing protein [Candidatus Thermoplasmatota archaeon]|nr:NUDIX domain-containing protein [Candidatus Thermoplasmatota archaeon]MCL5731072.1 NUDIX domain-containing protein [Candidatus Thermoplasmatota archaeon]
MNIRKVQCLIYRYNPDLQILLLHYSPPRSYWENLTGKVESGETDFECIRREILEECSIDSGEIEDVVRINSFQYSRDGSIIQENVYAVMISAEAQVDISGNPEMEHDRYKWVKPAKAIDLLKWDQMRKAVEILMELKGEYITSS